MEQLAGLLAFNSLAAVSLSTFLLVATPFARATFLVDDAEIARRLCPRPRCEARWNDVTLLMCSNATGYTPGKDYVWDSINLSHDTCLCPCNWPKFYK